MKQLTASFTVFLCILSGCTSVKNPGPTEHANFTEEERTERIELVIHVEEPKMSDLDDIIPEETKWWVYKNALHESRRLRSILEECDLFITVRSRPSINDGIHTLSVKPLPREFERTGFDDPMILIYGGIFPLHYKNNHSVAFTLKETGRAFHFNWSEEAIVGLIASALSSGSREWNSKREDEKYWNLLRAGLLEFFQAYTPKTLPDVDSQSSAAAGFTD